MVPFMSSINHSWPISHLLFLILITFSDQLFKSWENSQIVENLFFCGILILMQSNIWKFYVILFMFLKMYGTVFTIKFMIDFYFQFVHNSRQINFKCEVIEIQSKNIHSHTHSQIFRHFMFYWDINKFRIFYYDGFFHTLFEMFFHDVKDTTTTKCMYLQNICI